ncbi:NAD(P)H-hydrate dehydratase [Frateuria sp. STR12]|uniref:NAD(P)H-hydrate dehydratase n=1 Tax=Frateuria hangzhouensis TaxID=2995589 RepID=UPI0022610153|nr:NAD(P)H-hydrate dehydratase [Frateuria sp. STR12]MCX7514139.1 NAD(P)H-hydrate dehydratase [Frateuria sp. STR12]
MSAVQAKPQRLTARLLRTMPLPDPRGGKEQRGRVLVVGGSSRVPGAVLLAGTGALRAGAGKLQLATTQEVALPLAVAMPEALVLGLPVTAQGEIARGSPALDQALDGCDAVLVGCGMNPSAAAATLVQRVIRHMRGIAVIDAGALAPDLRAPPGKPFVLTPHAGEMAKLCGREKAQVEQEPHALACALARRARSVPVLKGATTHIAAPDGRSWVHPGGCHGLGTSGSGDVLAGVIAGLAARCGDAVQAALWGVFVHAEAGRVLEGSVGSLGFLAREIPGPVPGILDRI